jgi:hypothetical protein
MDELSSNQISIIYLSDLPLLNFPPDSYREKNHNGPLCAVAFRIYLVLHPPGRTANDVATATGGLLPHLLTLARRSFSEGGFPYNHKTPSGGYFLLRNHALTNISPFGNGVPCAARTFLYAKDVSIERSALRQR